MTPDSRHVRRSVAPGQSAAAVVVYGKACTFLDVATFHLAAGGMKPVPVPSSDQLGALLAKEATRCILLHWDTLQDASFSLCAALKACTQVPVVILAEQLSGGPSVLKAFAAGADGLIEGAKNPRILLTRLRSILGDERPLPRYA